MIENIFEKLENMEYFGYSEFVFDLEENKIPHKEIKLKENNFVILEYENERYLVELEKDSYLEAKEIEDWFYSLGDHEIQEYVDYEEEDFWEEVYNGTFFYHATSWDNLESIKENGLIPHSKTRAISNRFMPSSIFAHPNKHSISSYGDCVIGIDLYKMKMDGFTPEVMRETGVEEAKMKERLAGILRIDDFSISEYINQGMSQGLDEETIAITSSIPPKYLVFPISNKSSSNKWYKILSLKRNKKQ
jgi:hypothetical protein